MPMRTMHRVNGLMFQDLLRREEEAREMAEKNSQGGDAQGAVESVSLTELARRHAATWGDHSPSSVSMLAAFGKSLFAAQPPAPVETVNDRLRSALGSFLRILRGHSRILRDGYELNIERKVYDKAVEAFNEAIREKPVCRSSAGNADLESIYAALSQAQDCIRGETPEDISDEAAREDTIDKVRDAMRLIEHMQAQPQTGQAWRIEHDGFEGNQIGSYVTREGKRGVVLQQIGTRVVHVYGEKWLTCPLPRPNQPQENGK